MTSAPPPLPGSRQTTGFHWRRILLILVFAAGGLAGVFAVSLIVFRCFGMIIPYTVPTGAMSPEIAPGDSIVMEGFTYRKKSPRRGDIVVFRTDDIPGIGERSVYVKRLVGLPGDHLRIKDGVLYVNREPVMFRNRAGEIRYTNTGSGLHLRNEYGTETVPDGHYFVLGDNTEHSADSRYWGFVPAHAIKGRAIYCYGPFNRMGALR